MSGGTQRNKVPDGETANVRTNPTRESNQNPVDGSQRSIINIGALNETELLNMLIGYVNTITDFAKKTRNVHKELKDTLTNTGIVLHQNLKIKSSTPKGKDIKSTCTQTDEAPTN